MLRELLQMKEKQVRRTFSAVTGLHENLITEIQECYPFDLHISILTDNRTFTGKLTPKGNLIKDSLVEDRPTCNNQQQKP